MSTHFEKIENFLLQFDGGEIRLSKETVEKGVALLSINNCTKKNCITGKMMVQLRRCVEELENWEEGSAVIIIGVGDNFSAGGDLNFAKATGTEVEARWMAEWMQDTLIRLRQLPLFSVALVHGPTLGGGAEIAIACDFVIACETVRLGFVHAVMGITTAWGGTTMLAQKVGPTRALDILLSAEILDARKCIEYGIAAAIVSKEHALEESLEWIRKRLQGHHTIIRSYKKIIAQRLNMSSFELEKELFIPTWGGSPNKEALSKRIKHVKDQ